MNQFHQDEKAPHLKMLQENIARVFQDQWENRFSMAQTTARERIAKLKSLHEAVLSHKQEIRDALYADFKKPPAEVDLSEIFPVTAHIKHVSSNLSDWMRPIKVPTPFSLFGSSSSILHEPKGVVLIISPWNFPVTLTLGPLISAIAAGNCVMIKPSEYTPHTSSLLKRMLEKIFSENEVAVFEGDHLVSGQLLQRPFNHIFFTGGPEIGKIVMAKAAVHLTSVTLELGGKSPVIIDESANLSEAAKKIAWGKFVNNGQTCIAPDYVLVPAKKEAEFLRHLVKYVERMYGPTEEARQKSKDYARIIGPNHFSRLKGLLEKAKKKGAQVVLGGVTEENDRYISPTILSQVKYEDDIMQNEIFGPILPVLTYEDLGQALGLINSKDKPLALYIYSQNKENINTIIQKTSAGGTCINDNVLHFFQLNLPFGGTGRSGFGKAQGYFGFKSFSNERALLRQWTRWSAVQLMYPPYSKLAWKIIGISIRLF